MHAVDFITTNACTRCEPLRLLSRSVLGQSCLDMCWRPSALCKFHPARLVLAVWMVNFIRPDRNFKTHDGLTPRPT